MTPDLTLIGMYDSPYTRRVAITAAVLGLSFEHRPLSVFGDFETIEAINPAVKVPTLVVGADGVLSDSGEIIAYLETVAGMKLRPETAEERLALGRLVALGLTICEKTLQLVYERHLRPAEKQFEPWVERVTRQLHGALDEAERQLPAGGAWIADEGPPSHADIILAVAWRQAKESLHGIEDGRWPNLVRLSACAENSDAFRSAPFPVPR